MVDEIYIHHRTYNLRMSVVESLMQCVQKNKAVVLAFLLGKDGAKTFTDYVAFIIEENFNHVWDKLGTDITAQRFDDIYAIVFENGSILIAAHPDSAESANAVLEKLTKETKEASVNMT